MDGITASSTSGDGASVDAAAERFRALQAGFEAQYARVFSDDAAPRTILILPSLTLDAEVLSKISGVSHYEQRMLSLLMLLRYPRAEVIYVTSETVPPAIIDYYLHLLPGVPRDHAQRRLTMLSCHDASSRSLTEKILERPRLIERIRAAIPDPASAHMTCFNVSELERALALELGIPVYGCDPELLPLGSKSGSRRAFREAGVAMAEGVEDLGDAVQIAEALAELKSRDPSLRRAVVKLNEGFSGEGNAIFSFAGAPEGAGLRRWVSDRLAQMTFVARDMDWDLFGAKVEEMGGVAEAFIEGRVKRSPSAQYRIDPTGHLGVVSTHDQVTGGHGGQIFEGCRFPADKAYRLDIQADGLKVSEILRDKGVLGRFAIDFISVKEPGGWKNYAVEINLRKGGTTHPFQMLQFLTDGAYDPETGVYRTGAGRERCYYASDTLEAAQYRGLTPDDLIDIAVENRLHFHSVTQEGVVFHLIGALSEFGKLGLVCVAKTPRAAEQLYKETVAVLDREGRRFAR